MLRGREMSDSPLYCENSFLQITKNLEQALRHIRLPNHARRLWVDSICINQADLDERSLQVQRMRLIYKHAARVIVWLGRKVEGLEEAFSLARIITDMKTRPSEYGASLEKEGCRGIMRITSKQIEQNDGARRTLTHFYSRPYFRRMWCIQEIV